MTLGFGKTSADIRHLLSRDGIKPTNDILLYSGGKKNYGDLAERRRSFIFWPSMALAPGDDLAAAGFYYTGFSDTVSCHVCKMKHSNWQALDDPLDLHLCHEPPCMLARGISAAFASVVGSESSRSNRNTWRRDHNQNRRIDIPCSSPINIHVTGEGETQVMSEPVIVSRQAPRQPSLNPNLNLSELSDESQRFSSFRNHWLDEYPVSPHDLAKAGFFFKGPGDKVQCAFCKGIVHKWETGDTALGEHARLFPDCPFVAKLSSKPGNLLESTSAQAMLNMGHDEKAVSEVIVRLHRKGIVSPSTDQLVDGLFELEDEEMNKSREACILNEKISNSPTETNPEILLLKRENRNLKQSAVCKVCQDRDAVMLLLPCRHIALCMECSQEEDYCPLCHIKIVGTVKTFLS